MKESFSEIKNAVSQETVIERSKFICRIEKVATEEAARAVIDEVRKAHPFATHNCYAYVVNNGETARFSDDGEPQGTAGQPMLEVLKNKGLFNVVAVVTRYFGGIKLGAGGLVRAYSGAVSSAAAQAGTVVLKLSDVYEFSFAYDKLKAFEKCCASNAITVLSTDYSENITAKTAIVKPSENGVARIVDALSGKVNATFAGEGYYE